METIAAALARAKQVVEDADHRAVIAAESAAAQTPGMQMLLEALKRTRDGMRIDARATDIMRTDQFWEAMHECLRMRAIPGNWAPHLPRLLTLAPLALDDADIERHMNEDLWAAVFAYLEASDMINDNDEMEVAAAYFLRHDVAYLDPAVVRRIREIAAPDDDPRIASIEEHVRQEERRARSPVPRAGR